MTVDEWKSRIGRLVVDDGGRHFRVVGPKKKRKAITVENET